MPHQTHSSWTPDYNTLVRKLNDEEPYSWVRYGDGEWWCMMGHGKETRASKHFFYSGLKKELIKSVEHPKSCDFSIPEHVRRMPDIMRYIKKVSKVEKWGNADALAYAAWEGMLKPFVDALRKRDVILVGPDFLTPMGWDMIGIPKRNCYVAADRIEKDMRESSRPGRVFLLCAALTAEALIYRLHGELEGATMLDVGSVFDPFCGVMSRSYHRRMPKGHWKL